MISKFFQEIVDILAELFKKQESWLILFLLGVGGLTIVALPSIGVFAAVSTAIRFVAYFWWFWLFLIIVPMLESTWLFWKQEVFKKSLKFILLEIKIPRIIEKSPQAMEQVLANLHTLRNAPGDVSERYREGEVTVWFSLEIASFGGEVHFYIRCQKKQKNLVEAAVFSYYPDAELNEVPDYASDFPQTVEEMYATGKDMWGTEMVLTKDEAYPIKTYVAFESMDDEKKFDPISTFLEVLGKLKTGEIVAMQFLIAPGDDSWMKKWSGTLKKLKEPETISVAGGEAGDKKQMPVMRSPGQYAVLEAVERNLSKPAFDTLIRFCYISPKEIFYDSFARRGLVGAFRQYASLDLNGLRQNYMVSTRTQVWYWPHIFPKIRNEFKKQRLLVSYIKRDIPPETWMGRVLTSKLFNWNFVSYRFKMNT